MLEPGALFAEDGHLVDGFVGPMAGHEPGQVGIPVGHLDGEGQVAEHFEKAHAEGDIVVLEFSFLDHQTENVEAADQRARRDREKIQPGDDDPGPDRGFRPRKLRVGQDVDDGRDEKDSFRNEERRRVDGQALEVFLDVRLLDLAVDPFGFGRRQHAVLLALADHPDQPALPLGRTEEQPDRRDEHRPDPLLEIRLVRQEPVERGRKDGQRKLDVIDATGRSRS